MKKTWARTLALAAFLGLTFALSGCGKSASAGNQSTAKVIGTDFEVVQTMDSDSVKVALVSASGSVAEDGYMINGVYFIPDEQVDGQRSFFLSKDWRYKIVFTRLFKTSRGYFVGESHSADINPDKPEDVGYPANLQKIPDNSIAGWILPPRITVNFASSKIVVSENTPYEPPQHADEIEMCYSAFIRTGLPSLNVTGVLQDGRAVFVPEPSRGYASARTRIIDNEHNRIIVSAYSQMLEYE